MDTGAWWAAVTKGHKESAMTEQLTLASLLKGLYETYWSDWDMEVNLA